MILSTLIAKINQISCPFCDGYMEDFTYNEPTEPSSYSRTCVNCSQDNQSHVIISFHHDKPFFLITGYQNFTATLFFPIFVHSNFYTKLYYCCKLFATVNNWVEVNPTQPQEFLEIMQSLGILS